MKPTLSNQNQLLDVVRTCVIEFGPSVATKEIAERLGVTEECLYDEYGSKTNLLAKVFGYDQLLPWISRVQSGPEPGCLKQQLMDIAGVLTPYFVEYLPSSMAIWSASQTYYSENVPERQDPRDESPSVMARYVLAGWFQRAQEQGRLGPFDPHLAAVMFIGSCIAPAARLHLGEDFIEVDPYVHSFVEIFYRGLGDELAE